MAIGARAISRDYERHIAASERFDMLRRPKNAILNVYKPPPETGTPARADFTSSNAQPLRSTSARDKA